MAAIACSFSASLSACCICCATRRRGGRFRFVISTARRRSGNWKWKRRRGFDGKEERAGGQNKQFKQW